MLRQFEKWLLSMWFMQLIYIARTPITVSGNIRLEKTWRNLKWKSSKVVNNIVVYSLGLNTVMNTSLQIWIFMAKFYGITNIRFGFKFKCMHSPVGVLLFFNLCVSYFSFGRGFQRISGKEKCSQVNNKFEIFAVLWLVFPCSSKYLILSNSLLLYVCA